MRRWRQPSKMKRSAGDRESGEKQRKLHHGEMATEKLLENDEGTENPCQAISNGDGEKKPTGEEPEAKNKEELSPRGRHEQRKKKTMVEVKEYQRSCGSCWIFSTIRDMEEINSNRTMMPRKPKSMMKLKNQRCSKLRMEEPWLKKSR
ncbi:hypothetical protein Bca4012_081737 [Brassica carinata]